MSATIAVSKDQYKELIADRERLDWLLENASIRDYLIDGIAYCLEEGREFIDAARFHKNENNF